MTDKETYEQGLGAYQRYTKDSEAFEQTKQCKNFMRIKEEADKAWEEVEASDEWKAYSVSHKEDSEAALLNSKIWQDWIVTKQDLLKVADALPNNLFKNYLGCEVASDAYKKVWEDTGDHEKAMAEYDRIVNVDAYKQTNNVSLKREG